eukprot:scaffold1244_cov162-Ochromonas_danica.AAC.48
MFSQPFPTECERVLLVTAHPDDEVMFFSPFLEAYRSSNSAIVSILCLSTGNDDGLGEKRKIELQQCVKYYGIESQHVFIIDHPNLQDGMANHWSPEVIAEIYQDHVNVLRPDLVVTFDDYGVSGHPNHIAVYQGVRLATLRSSGENLPKHVLKLCSKPLIRKFWGVFDVPLSFLCDETMLVVNGQPWRTALAFAQHTSQMLVYRQAFILLSSFTYINSFRHILDE